MEKALRRLEVCFPRAALFAVAFGVCFTVLLVLIQPYIPKQPVDPYPFGSVQWWNWYIYN